MIRSRTPEDLLREEYFDLLPEVRKASEEIDARVRHTLIPVSRSLERWERLIITSRVKSCESAIDKLRRQQQGGIFDPELPGAYTMRGLKDLAGVRVMVFPHTRIDEIQSRLTTRAFKSWTADPFGEGPALGLKFVGACFRGSKIQCELQVVRLLTGLFWEVEHNTLYKPAPELKGIERDKVVRRRMIDVLRALQLFEDEFVRVVKESE